MAIYARPTKALCLLTVCVILWAAAMTFFIAFSLAQEWGRHAGQSQQGEVK